jgi:hypothetical protein
MQYQIGLNTFVAMGVCVTVYVALQTIQSCNVNALQLKMNVTHMALDDTLYAKLPTYPEDWMCACDS